MRKISAFLIAMLALCGIAMAAPVDNATARRVAIHFWNSHRPEGVRPVADLQPIQHADLPHLHVFANGEEGFVIVSADDRTRPILAYSFESSAPQTLHPEVRYWLRGYESQYEAVELLPEMVSAGWEELLADVQPLTPISLTLVPKLCQTTWNQSEPFNAYCPYDSVENDRTVVGCVATAMAQIMKRWNHPSCGTDTHSYTPHSMWYDEDENHGYGVQSADFGNTTYLWENMPNHATAGASARATKALGTLCYHCGVAVDMMYGTHAQGGSGAWSSQVAEVLPKYFKYNSDIQYLLRYNYNEAEWCALIDSNLSKGYPIYYSGSDQTGGHAFVLDGSNLDSTYHFNWGWGGSYDGFYTINNLAPGSGGIGGNATYTFNNWQEAVFNIHPVPEVFDTVSVYDSICNDITAYDFYEHTFAPHTVDTMLRHLTTYYDLHLYVRNTNIAIFNANLGLNSDQQSISYCRYNGVVMPKCEYSKPGHFFGGWSKTKSGSEPLYQTGDTIFLVGNITLYAAWIDSSKLSLTDLSIEDISVFPNPASHTLTIRHGSIQAEATLRDMVGRCVRRVTLPSIEGKIDVADLPEGCYVLQVFTPNGIFNARIIKQ